MSKPLTAAQKRAARRKKQATRANRLAQAVTTVACILAAAYVIVRIINWIRFI